MISLIASLTGFLGSALPHLINYYRDKADKKHEIVLFNLQLKQQQYNNQHLEELRVGEHLITSSYLYNTYHHENKIVNALNGLVRPLLAYAFFILYVYVKYQQISFYNELGENFDLLWSLEDQAIFASIISLYFGQRAMHKLYNRSK
jgi:hypothetical protein